MHELCRIGEHSCCRTENRRHTHPSCQASCAVDSMLTLLLDRTNHSLHNDRCPIVAKLISAARLIQGDGQIYIQTATAWFIAANTIFRWDEPKRTWLSSTSHSATSAEPSALMEACYTSLTANGMVHSSRSQPTTPITPCRSGGRRPQTSQPPRNSVWMKGKPDTF